MRRKDVAVATVAAAGLAVTAKLVLNLLRNNKNSGKLNLFLPPSIPPSLALLPSHIHSSRD